MTRHLLIAMAALSFICVSCSKEVPYNSNSGDNGTRALAVAIDFNKGHVDDLSANTGDNEDWYYFQPTEPGEITVSVVIENPSGFVVSLGLYDSFGRELQSRESDASSDLYALDKIEVTTDRYFVAVKTNKGEGKYTLNVSFEVPKIEETVADTAGDDKSSSKSSCVPADKCKAGQKCCKSRSSSTTTNPSSTATTQQPAEEEVSATAKTIKGTIVLITPRGDDLSDIKINGIGLKNNVKPGMKAVLRGLKRKVDIYKCLNTSCQATVKATSEELGNYDTVDVYVE